MSLEPYELGADFAEACDQHDALNQFRQRFYLPPDQIYLDGNSLGLASKDAEMAVLAALDDWKRYAIDGWAQGPRPWYYTAETLGDIQANLVGALSVEVVVTGTTTVNLHSLVATFYRPEGNRTKILADTLNFSSDLYALSSQVRLRGYDPDTHLVLVQSRDGRTVQEEDLIAAMTDEIALVVLPSVLYRSGQLLDMAGLTKAAHDRGIIIGFDCCHSVGILPHHLHDWGVDFALWCNYKYLNGGPGAVASLYVHEHHFGRTPGLAGWFGSDKARQFDLSLAFHQAADVGAWQISAASVLSAASLFGSLNMFQEAGVEAMRAKSLHQTGYLMFLADHLLSRSPYDFVVGTPRDPDRRGGHVALEHPEAARICKALKARGVIPDFRSPNVIRLAPVPLHTSYREVWQTVQILRSIRENGEHAAYSEERNTVA